MICSQEEDEDAQSNGLLTAEQPQTAVLVIGRSGTGKTSLVKWLLKDVRKPIFVVNDKTSNKSFTKIEWSQLPALRSCALVCEDIISATKPQVTAMQNLLSFGVHHSKVSPVVIIIHQIYKQNIFALVPFFNKIYLTANTGSVTSLRVILRLFQYEQKEIERCVSLIKQDEKKFMHLVINQNGESPQLGRVDDFKKKVNEDNISSKARLDQASAVAKRFLSILEPPKAQYGIAIFEILFPEIPEKIIQLENLTLTLMKRKDKKKRSLSSSADSPLRPKGQASITKNYQRIKYSLLDYIYALVTPNYKLNRKMERFHKYITQTLDVTIPQCFIHNERMKEFSR
jgi:energy-coupling factor transporter ATP-binding protein EcfA2